MILVTSNKSQRLLCLNYLQRVTPAELESVRKELQAQLAELPADFRLLADLSQLEYMDPECTVEIGRAMDMFYQHGVSLIIRVIPDASKDIGLNILAVFHYPQQPRVINCRNLAEAVQKLAIF